MQSLVMPTLRCIKAFAGGLVRFAGLIKNLRPTTLDEKIAAFREAFKL